jgi:hypothetical protein
MRRHAKPSAVVMLMGLAAVAMAPTSSFGQGGKSPLLPPNAHFRGQSLEAWSVLWTERFVGNEFGTGSESLFQKGDGLP